MTTRLFNKSDPSEVMVGKIQGRIFGRDRLTEAQLNHHVHVVGASGFGKTVFLTSLIKQRIEQGKGLFFIDLKADIETLHQFSKVAEACGRVDDFQVFSLTEKKLSLPYNLIANGTATQLRDRIMSSLTWSEEFYKHQAGSFLLKTLIVLCHLRDHAGTSLHLGTVLRAVSDPDFLRELCALVQTEDEDVRDRAEEAVWMAKDKDQWASLQGLRAQLESIVRSDFGSLVATDKPGIDLFETVRAGKLVFLFLDTRRYGETAKAIGRFILQDLKAVSARIDAEVSRADRRPFSVIIDEFADLAQEDFIGFLDRARSSRISVTISHQEMSDLDRVSPEFANRVIANTASLYAFLQKNPKSAELVSSIAGTHTVQKKTYQHGRLLLWSVPTGGTSVRDVEEFLVHPNTVKSLRVGQCVVVKKYPKAEAYVIRVNVNG